MCGSGIFLIEAISHYLKIPNLNKKKYLFENWIDFQKDIFISEKLKLENFLSSPLQMSKVIGCEIDPNIFNQAKNNIKLSGLDNYIELFNSDFANLKVNYQPGIIVCNPPYGIRIGQEKELVYLYSKLGDHLKRNFSGWTFWLLSGNPNLTKYLRMKASLKIPVNNGGLDCRWIKYLIR